MTATFESANKIPIITFRKRSHTDCPFLLSFFTKQKRLLSSYPLMLIMCAFEIKFKGDTPSPYFGEKSDFAFTYSCD